MSCTHFYIQPIILLWPEGKATLILLLVADVLFKVIQGPIVLFVKDKEKEANTIIVFFVLTYIFLLVAVVVFSEIITEYRSREHKNSRRKYLWIDFFHCLSRSSFCSNRLFNSGTYLFGATLYFYGGNIMPILFEYSEQLGCNDACQANHKTAGIVCMGLSVLIFQIVSPCTCIPPCHSNWHGNNDYHINIEGGILEIYKSYRTPRELLDYHRVKRKDCINVFNEITVFIQADMTFTTVLYLYQTADVCNDPNHNVVDIHWYFFLISWFTVGLFLAFPYHYGEDLAVRIAMICIYPMYILSDNNVVLDCGSDCGRFGKFTWTCMNMDKYNLGKWVFSLITFMVGCFVFTFRYNAYQNCIHQLNEHVLDMYEVVLGPHDHYLNDTMSDQKKWTTKERLLSCFPSTGGINSGIACCIFLPGLICIKLLLDMYLLFIYDWYRGYLDSSMQL